MQKETKMNLVAIGLAILGILVMALVSHLDPIWFIISSIFFSFIIAIISTIKRGILIRILALAVITLLGIISIYLKKLPLGYLIAATIFYLLLQYLCYRRIEDYWHNEFKAEKEKD